MQLTVLVLIVVFLSCLETVLQTKNSYTLHQVWLELVKGLKRNNSYVAYVSRRVLNSRYTKFGWNRLRGYRVNLEHTYRQTDTHTLSLLYIYIYIN
jgi:hypothetical protein